MLSKGYGRLVVLIIILIIKPPSHAKSIYTGNCGSNHQLVSKIFELPLQINKSELFEEFTRLTLASMNQDIHPCEDFYAYACGNWRHSDVIPERFKNSAYHHYTDISVNEMVIEFLKNPTNKKLKLNNSIAKAKSFFQTCMRKSGDMHAGYSHFLQIEEYTGKLIEWLSASGTFDWININFLSPYGIYPLLPLNIEYIDERRTYVVVLNTTAKVLSNLDESDIENLRKDFKIENENELCQFNEEFQEAVAFEQQLTLHTDNGNEVEELFLGEFKSWHNEDALNWARYFEVAFNGRAKDYWIIRNKISDVNSLVIFLQKTDLETLRLYVKWRTLIKFHSLWKHESYNEPKETKCLKKTEIYFSKALDLWFINNAFDGYMRADILWVAKLIKETFDDHLDMSTWLDDATYSHAKAKLRDMHILVGYTHEMRNPNVIDQIYKDVEIGTCYYENIQLLERHKARALMSLVNKWDLYPFPNTRTANAFYKLYFNAVFIHSAISQAPLYHITYPPSIKFSGIGSVIGHEIGHGFDSDLFGYTSDAKLNDCLTKASLKNLQGRYGCLESQYNKFVHQGVFTNGAATSAENIADNLATHIAYYAYLNNFGMFDGDEKPIPDLDFTNKELFFLKYAQLWCTGNDDYYDEMHVFNKFRVIGPLQNMPEFSEVFKCKLGSYMNPSNKCVVF